jgi:hypothetical protein
MKKILFIALAALPAASSMATIIGSSHDLANASWNTRKGVCSPCHTAHNTDTNQLVPLWSHATTTSTFTPYTSPSMQATYVDSATKQPGSTSKACLSCHDGTIATNSTMDGSAMTGAAAIALGNDLHTTHPISIKYDAALAAQDAGLFDPTTHTIQWGVLSGQLIKDALLKGPGHDQIECGSCHDVHKMAGDAPTSGIMARISAKDANGEGSTLCRTCHNK